VVFHRYIASVPVRKIGWGRGRTGLHTLVTISATAIMNLSCDLLWRWWVTPRDWIFKRLPSPRQRGERKKKKDSFMIHFEPHRWEFSAANVFPSHFRWFLSSREREKKAGECQMVLAMLTGTTPLFAITWQPPP
jgi:hypothetical protein